MQDKMELAARRTVAPLTRAARRDIRAELRAAQVALTRAHDRVLRAIEALERIV